MWTPLDLVIRVAGWVGGAVLLGMMALLTAGLCRAAAMGEDGIDAAEDGRD